MVPTCFLGLFCWLGLFMFHWLWSDQHHPCSATGEWTGLKLFWFIIYKRPGHMTQSGLLIGWWWRGCLAWLPGCMSSLSLMQIRVKVVVFLARSFYWGKLASRPILCNILNLEIWIFILPPCTIMVYCNLPQLEIVFALVTEVLILLDTERLT